MIYQYMTLAKFVIVRTEQQNYVDFPVGDEINYSEYNVSSLRKMTTMAVRLDGKVEVNKVLFSIVNRVYIL